MCALDTPVLDAVNVSSTTGTDGFVLACGGVKSCNDALGRVLVVRDVQRGEPVVRGVGNTSLGAADAASAEVEVVAVQALVSDRRDTVRATSTIKWGTV